MGFCVLPLVRKATDPDLLPSFGGSSLGRLPAAVDELQDTRTVGGG